MTSLHFKRGKVCKPYNSVLGEHFRAHWDVIPVSYPADPREPPLQHLYISNPASTSTSAGRLSTETDSVKSGRSAFSYMSFGRTTKSTPGTSPEPVESNIDAQISNLSLGAGATELLEADSDDKTKKRIRVIYVTEQVSHHPPVSSYYATCPARQVERRGVDQISAKVSGTTLRVNPGSYNKGIFVNIAGGPGEGEEYHITHPVASVNGILRGNFYITVADSTIVTSRGAEDGVNYRAIIEYKEEVRWERSPGGPFANSKFLSLGSGGRCSHWKELSTPTRRAKQNTRSGQRSNMSRPIESSPISMARGRVAFATGSPTGGHQRPARALLFHLLPLRVRTWRRGLKTSGLR